MKRSSQIIAVCVALSGLFPTGLVFASDGSDTTVPSSSTTNETNVPTSVPTSTTTSVAPLQPPERARIAVGFVLVVLSEQRVYVYNTRKRLIATMPVSTGADDTTPVGTFKVFSKSAQAYYSPNPGERMKYMTRFTKGREGDNIGFHGIPYRVTPKGDIPMFTPVGVTPVSHGCVRMRVSDAKWLFNNIKLGSVVRVVNSRR